jgi:hypothetical protein
MHLLTIRPALALLTILPYVFGFNINRLLDIFNEEHLAERFQPGFRLPFRRQASSVFVATPTSAGGGSAIVTTVPQSNPPSFVTTSGVSITDTGGSTEVSVSTVPPPSSSPSSSPSAGCAAGYASFNGKSPKPHPLQSSEAQIQEKTVN